MSVSKNSFYFGVLFALINSMSLGTLGIIDKLGSSSYPNPLTFSTQSVFFGFLFATLFAILYKKNQFINECKTLSRNSWLLVLLVGAFASIFILFRFLGLTQSTGTFATLSQIITSALTTIIALLFLKEKVSKYFWGFFLLILTATYFVSVSTFSFSNIQVGDGFIIVGTFFLAINNILSKLAIKHVSPTTLAAGRFFFGVFILSIITIITFGYEELFQTFSTWAILSGIFWAVNIIAFNFAIQRISITLTTSLLMIAPIYTMVLEYIFLKQLFTPVQIIAALIVIISGILMVITKNK